MNKDTKFWREANLTVNAAVDQLLMSRQAIASRNAEPDHRRSLEKECGYPRHIFFNDYRLMYEREGVATRVVSIYPDECWAVDPLVYETERARATPFEQDWNDLCETETTNPLHYLHRADIISGIGSFGLLLIGSNGKLDTPLDGIDNRGVAISRNGDNPVNYFRVFDESMVTIAEYEMDEENPRYGLPTMYSVAFADMMPQPGGWPAVTEQGPLAPTVTNGTNAIIREVHWSRCIHLVDNRESSEVFGAPRMRPVFNKLMDVQKVLGSSAEMFYKGGFPGLSIEIDPRVMELLNVEIDQDSIDEEMYKYMNGLRRYLTLIGMKAHSLAPQVANPEGNLTAELESIAMSIGAPLRIFMGSEQAKLASGQDVRAWNRRLRRRQHRYLTPWVLRPLVNRLIAIGAIRPPKVKTLNGNYTFKVFWPDVNMPDEDTQSQIADRRAASLMKFVMSGAWQMQQPSDFYRFVWGLTQEEIKVVMKNMKKSPEIVFKPLPGQTSPDGPADSGTNGNPPSKPSAGR